ncbi:MAG: hypothetical protein P8X42_11350, partial [Calditrichaceae bacterium]
EYQMISIPFNSKGQTVSELFLDNLGNYDNTKFRVFDWDQADSEFIELKDMAQKLPPGKALYLITKESKVLDINDCVTTKTDKPYALDLKKGWNMISVPFAFPVSWTDIHQFNNGTDLNYWNGKSWEKPDVLEPFKGYGFYATSDTVLYVPARESTLQKTENLTGKSGMNSGKDEWYFRISAKRGAHSDECNYAGVHDGSTDNLDRWDSHEPPGIGDYISLFFTEFSGTKQPVQLSSDFIELM